MFVMMCHDMFGCHVYILCYVITCGTSTSGVREYVFMQDCRCCRDCVLVSYEANGFRERIYPLPVCL